MPLSAPLHSASGTCQCQTKLSAYKAHAFVAVPATLDQGGQPNSCLNPTGARTGRLTHAAMCPAGIAAVVAC
jgi:hypothetical protein